MTVEEGRRRLAQAMGVSPHATASWLTGPVVNTSGVDKVEREHNERIRKLQERADTRIATSRQQLVDLVAQSRRSKALLRDEYIEKRRQDDRVELTWRRDHREFLAAIGGQLSPRDEQQLADEIEEQNATPNAPEVVRMRTWLEREWTAAGIDVRICVDPALRNGAAARTGHYVEIPPVQSVITAAIVAHELGHMLHAPIENERTVDGDFGRKICVESELRAWRWVLDRTPHWTEAMHSFMTRALNTYRPSAIESEALAMDDLCSPMTFRLTLVRIWRTA